MIIMIKKMIQKNKFALLVAVCAMLCVSHTSLAQEVADSVPDVIETGNGGSAESSGIPAEMLAELEAREKALASQGVAVDNGSPRESVAYMQTPDVLESKVVVVEYVLGGIILWLFILSVVVFKKQKQN